jgi:hypothetical protein
LNKKIYIRSDISSWDYLIKDLGLTIYDFNDIGREPLEKLIKKINNDNDKKLLNTVYSEKYIKDIWNKNFEE